MSHERKFYWVMLLLSGFGMLALLNCGDGFSAAPTVQYTQADRFDVAKHGVTGDNPDIWTITDKDSGCQYMFTKLGYAGGLVLMPHTCAEEKR